MHGSHRNVLCWPNKLHLWPTYIYVCDADAACRDAKLPDRLNDGPGMAKFVRNVLPGILREMQEQHGWSRIPRTLVHDKDGYFVAPKAQRLASTFAAALRDARMSSWLGDADADCSWLAGRLGDVYPHETIVSHIRRGLDHRFPRATEGETRARFAHRMAKVQEHMNSNNFQAPEGGGLASLARSLRERCHRLSLSEGERLRT